MFKITLKLFLVLVVLAMGSFAADQVMAAQDHPTPALTTDDQVPMLEDLIFGMAGDNGNGNDGDPDSAGTGLGFLGDFIFDGFGEIVEPGDDLWNEMVRLYLENMLPQP